MQAQLWKQLWGGLACFGPVAGPSPCQRQRHGSEQKPLPVQPAAAAAAAMQRWREQLYLRELDSRRARPPSCSTTVHVHGGVTKVILQGVSAAVGWGGCGRWRRLTRKWWRAPSRRCGTGACASTSAASWASASPSCPGGPSPATCLRWGCLLLSRPILCPSLSASQLPVSTPCSCWLGVYFCGAAAHCF